MGSSAKISDLDFQASHVRAQLKKFGNEKMGTKVFLLLDVVFEMKEVIISIYDGNLEEKRDELYKKHRKHQQQFEERRRRKWKKF